MDDLLTDQLPKTGVPFAIGRAGNIHHFARRTPDDAAQARWATHLEAAGLDASPVGEETWTRHEDRMDNRFYSFIGGDVGPWRTLALHSVTGPGLEEPPRLEVQNANVLTPPAGARWLLRGVTSHGRYTTRTEQNQLAAVQPSLGRPEATCAALIPITKNAAWWALTQDERRELFAAGAVHTTAARAYLPAIARRLHHGRDLPGEPFDFLTWFEYAPAESAAFEDLLGALRASEEWCYVEREVDLRLVRDAVPPES